MHGTGCKLVIYLRVNPEFVACHFIHDYGFKIPNDTFNALQHFSYEQGTGLSLKAILQ